MRALNLIIVKFGLESKNKLYVPSVRLLNK